MMKAHLSLIGSLFLLMLGCSGPETRKDGVENPTKHSSSDDTPLVNAAELYRQGVQAERDSDPQGARAAYQQVLEAEPAHLPALLNLLRLQARSGPRVGDVLEQARAHWAAHPEHPELQAGVIEALLFAGLHAEAETEALSWIARDPDAFEGHFYLAYALVAQGSNAQLARESLLWAGDRHPRRAEGFWLHGVLLIQQGDLLGAGQELERALELRPDYAEAHLASGVIDQRLRRFDKAEAHHRAAVEAAPTLREAHLHHGHSLRLLGREEEAAAAYARALELSPDWDGAKAALEALQAH